MRKIIVLVISIIMMLVMLAGCKTVNKTTVTRMTASGVETETYYTINGHKYSEEEYEVLVSMGLWD